MDKCRDTDSDDSEENQEDATSCVNTSRINTVALPEPKWEFVARDVDSGDDDEEPALVDGVDFNVYLTRRPLRLAGLHPPGPSSRRGGGCYPFGAREYRGVTVSVTGRETSRGGPRTTTIGTRGVV